jgi:hypothetical protein
MSELDDEGPVVWELRCGETVIATVAATGQDFPWMWGPFESLPAFEPIRHLFVVHPNRESSVAARAELSRLGISLRPRGGRPVREFTLRIDGEEAAFTFL